MVLDNLTVTQTGKAYHSGRRTRTRRRHTMVTIIDNNTANVRVVVDDHVVIITVCNGIAQVKVKEV
jgi:hypothetical protein